MDIRSFFQPQPPKAQQPRYDIATTIKKKGETMCDFCEEYGDTPRLAATRRCIGGGDTGNAYDYLCEVCERRGNEEAEPTQRDYNETEKFWAGRGFVELNKGVWVKGKLIRVLMK